jgi:hypothetical protein
VKPTGGEGYEVDGLQYVGTCIDDNHKLVWHVFEVL